MLKPQHIKKRVDAAKEKLPRLTAKVASLTGAERKIVGPLPTAIKTIRDIVIVEELSDRLGLDAVAPAVKAAPVPSRGAEVLKAITNPAVNGPVVAGVKAALTAQAKIDAKLVEVKSLRTPREKIEALQAFKHDTISAENVAHSERCKSKRDEILGAMKARMAGKK